MRPSVVLVDPLSSGRNLSRAFQEKGVDVLHLWEARFADEMARDRIAIRTMLYDDHATAIRQLQELRPIALMAGAEYGIAVADKLAAELGLPHNTPEESLARRDKGLMLKAVAAAGVPVAGSFLVHDERELDGRIEELGGFPVIIKPTNSAAGDGLALCRSADEARAAFRAVHQQPNIVREINRGVLVQEYVGGPQYVVNTVSMRGRHLLTDYYTQRVDLRPDRTVTRHVKSKRRLDAGDTEIVAYAMACLDALGVREGPAHTEIRVSAGGPRLIEVNSRLMGPIMEPDAYTVAFGYAPQDLVVERIVDPDSFEARFDVPYAPPRALARPYMRADRPGIIRGMRGFDRLRSLPGYHSAHLLPRLGDRISHPFFATGSSGVVYLVHEDDAVLDASLAQLHEWVDAGAFFEMADE